MEARMTFAEIMRRDDKVKMLLAGIVLDGALIIALVVSAALACIL